VERLGYERGEGGREQEVVENGGRKGRARSDGEGKRDV